MLYTKSRFIDTIFLHPGSQKNTPLLGVNFLADPGGFEELPEDIRSPPAGGGFLGTLILAP
jgi:hypothetical protein